MKAMAERHFEYKTTTYWWFDSIPENELNEEGKNGWELVAISTIQTEEGENQHTAYFKREIVV